jgi:hypothetical protein
MSQGDFDTPLGQLLEWLNGRCIFDIGDTAAARAATAAAEDEPDDPEFWDSFVREQIRLDNRVSQYQQRLFDMDSVDGVLALLRGMLAQTPDHDGIRALGPKEESPGGGRKTGPTGPNVQLRAFNVLYRWCNALDDPRLRWVDAWAPARNFVHLAYALMECLKQGLLNDERLTSLCETLLSSSLGTEQRPGFLATYSEDEMPGALEILNEDVRAIITAFIYWGLRQEVTRRSVVFRWQHAVVRALNLDLVRCTPEVAAQLDELVSSHVTPQAMEERILWAALFIDDEEWCRRTAIDLAIDGLSFSSQKYGTIPYALILDPKSTNLGSPSLVPLVRLVFRYKKTQNAVLVIGSSRLAFQLNKELSALVDGVMLKSRRLVSYGLIDELEGIGAGWDTVLYQAKERAG